MKTKRLSCIRLNNGRLWFEAYEENGNYVLDWKKVAKAALSARGRLLSFQQRAHAKDISVNIMKGIVNAYCNSLSGKECWHATVIERCGKSLALCGPSGMGKSTLTASLLAKNQALKLLTDDVAYLHITNKNVLVHSTAPSYLKLHKKTRERFNIQNLKQIIYDPNLQKEILFFANTHDTSQTYRPVALTAVYQLCRMQGFKKATLQKIKGAKAALILYANIYNEILRPPHIQKKQFFLCAEIATRVPVYELRYPTGFLQLKKAEKILLRARD